MFESKGWQYCLDPDVVIHRSQASRGLLDFTPEDISPFSGMEEKRRHFKTPENAPVRLPKVSGALRVGLCAL